MAITTQQLIEMETTGASDCSFDSLGLCLAQLLDAAGVDLILVGDTLAVGYETTLPVTMDRNAAPCQSGARG